MSESTRDPPAARTDGPARVDPRAPRFGQAITASGLALGVAFQRPELVYAVAAVLLAAVLTRWQYDPYGIAWRRLVLPRISRAEPEPAAPHRFAKLLGAVGTSLASALLLAGLPVAGYAIAGLVAVAAGLAATTGVCLGCRMYRGVALFRDGTWCRRKPVTQFPGARADRLRIDDRSAFLRRRTRTLHGLRELRRVRTTGSGLLDRRG